MQWGGLNTYFTRSDEADPGVFQSWWYRSDRDPSQPQEQGGPAPEEFDLPADLQFGDPMTEIEVQLGLPVTVDDELFLIAFAGNDSFTLMSDEPSVDAPLVTVAVPFQPACE